MCIPSDRTRRRGYQRSRSCDPKVLREFQKKMSGDHRERVWSEVEKCELLET